MILKAPYRLAGGPCMSIETIIIIVIIVLIVLAVVGYFGRGRLNS